LRVLQETLLDVIFADPPIFFETAPNGTLQTRRLEDIPPAFRHLISGVTTDQNGNPQYKLRDKDRASDQLLKTLGAYAPQTEINIHTDLRTQIAARLDAAIGRAHTRSQPARQVEHKGPLKLEVGMEL
jgi:hypothetical protein